MNHTKIKKSKLWFNALFVSSIFLAASCANDETNLIEGEALNEATIKEEVPTLGAKVTPKDEGVYTITAVKSGRTLDISGASNNNGANLQVWGTDSNTGATHRQWEVLSTGGNYVRLKGVDSGKSLEVEDGSNSNNANVEQRSYGGETHQQWEILPVGNDNFRLKNRDSGKSLRVSGTSNGSNADQYAYKGWESQKFYFTQVGGSSGGGDDNDDDDDNDGGGSSGGGDSNGNTAGAILGLTNSNWKLNGFTESPSSSADYHDDVMDEINGNIATWSNSNYFFENNGWAYFKAYRGMESSSGSGNPRVELRELSGGNSASWNGDNGTHTLSFTVRVDQLPNGWNKNDDEERDTGTVCFGQIHGPSGTNSNGVEVDDTIRVQFDGDRGQKSGNVKLKISGYITEEQGGGSESFDGYKLDTSYNVQIIFSNDRVSVKMNGSEVFGRTMDTAGNGSYFKLGSYIQSVQEGSFDGSYGLVGFKNLSVSHP